jgi:hypothetical protein
MSDDEKPAEVDDKPKEAATEPEESQAEGKPAETETPADGDEKERKDDVEEDLKANATDKGKARRLASQTRARAEGVSSFLPGTRATNIFIGSNIDLLDTGGHRPTDATHGGVVTGSVTDEALRHVATTFVAPDRYDRLLTQLRQRSVVLLRAAPGWGRMTTALYLLSSECAQGVEKLNPDVSLRVPRELGLRAGRGHFLEWLDTDEAERLHEFHLERLGHALEEQGSLMIVLLEPDTPIRDEALSAYLFEGGAPPDSRAVVASHFTAHLATAGKSDQEIGHFTEFVELIDGVIETERRVGGVAEFARDLGEVVLDRITLDIVRDRYANTAEGAFRDWFDGLGDNDQRAFVIALAVFHGMPLHTVVGTATLLGMAMQAAENPDPKIRLRAIFALRRSDLIERAGADVVTTSEITDLGPLAARAVRYRDDRRPRKILEHVWWEYDEAHAVVRQWLYELGQSPDARICARAGVAVGLLSLSEFDHVRQLVIEPWAAANSEDQLEAVMGALELPSRSPELQPLIVKMLTGWLRSTSIGLRVAAIRALGAFGLVSPGRALRMMRRAVGTSDDVMPVTYAVAEAVMSLAVIPGRLGQVLMAVLRWSDDIKTEVRNTGLLCALKLGVYLYTSVAGSAEAWPALLHVAEHEPPPQQPMNYQHEEIGFRRAVVIMLGRVLNAPFYVPAAISVLKLWVEVAQKDPTQRAPLGRLLFDVAEETGDEASLRFYLDEWARGRKNNAEAVADIVAALDREGQLRG